MNASNPATFEEYKCKFPNCYTRPTYCKVSGSKKDTEYCKQHSPLGYIDVVHKKSKHSNCDTRPTYGKNGTKKLNIVKTIAHLDI